MLRTISAFLVDRRRFVIGFMLLVAIGFSLLIPRINVNTDLTEYLPPESSMRQGMDAMEDEFGEEDVQAVARVMVKGLDDASRADALNQLKSIDGITDVTHADSPGVEREHYIEGDQTLFVLTADGDYNSSVFASVQSDLNKLAADGIDGHDVVWADNNPSNASELPLWIVLVSVALVVIVLLIMSASWVEPALFLLAIGMAVGINMGLAAFRDSISDVTFAMAALLQLVLSMDYSIILSNRYRQERAKQEADGRRDEPGAAPAAMKVALEAAFPAVASASLTTVVGLFMLVFMSFRIGADLGTVMALGVALSLFTVLTVLPGLLVMFDGPIARSAKPHPQPKLLRLAHGEYRFRKVIAVGFIALFIGTYVLQGRTVIAYDLDSNDPVAGTFARENPVVLVYDADDEEAAAEIARDLEEKDAVRSVAAYSTTLGKPMSADDMVSTLDEIAALQEDNAAGAEDEGGAPISPQMLRFVYADANIDDPKLTINELIEFLDLMQNDPDLKATTQEFGGAMGGDADEMAAGVGQLKQAVEFGLISREELNTPLTAQEMSVKLRELSDTAAAKGAEMARAGDRARALGAEAQTLGDRAKALGAEAQSLGDRAKALGAEAQALGEQAVALGGAAKTAGERAIALGAEAQTLGDRAKALGAEAKALGEQARALGAEAEALGEQARALGAEAEALGEQARALGAAAEQAAAEAAAAAQNGDPVTAAAKAAEAAANMAAAEQAGAEAAAKGAEAERLGADAAAKGAEAERIGAEAAAKGAEAERIGAEAAAKGAEAEQAGAEAAANKTAAEQTGANAAAKGAEAERIGADAAAKGAEAERIGAGARAKGAEAERVAAEAIPPGMTREQAEKLAAQGGGAATQKAVDVDANKLSLLYTYRASSIAFDDAWTMSIDGMLTHITDRMLEEERYKDLISEDQRAQLTDASDKVTEAKGQMLGQNVSRMIVTTTLLPESAETTEFMHTLDKEAAERLGGEYHLIGDSAMVMEMQDTFDAENLRITLLTAGAIFLIVAITFRSIAVPALLVGLVQGGVFVTISVIGLQGYDIYFLAMIIVQCILMGATIDYAIVLTSYYREHRRTEDVAHALAGAYHGAIHTILTSGSILILVTAVLGFLFENPAVAQICRTISLGTTSTVLLVVFVLPALLAVTDRLVVLRGQRFENLEAKGAEGE